MSRVTRTNYLGDYRGKCSDWIIKGRKVVDFRLMRSMLFGPRHFFHELLQGQRRRQRERRKEGRHRWRSSTGRCFYSSSTARRTLRLVFFFFLSTPERRIGEQTARTKLPRAKDFLRDASCERDCQELHYPPSLRPVIRSLSPSFPLAVMRGK